jgi:hypothetical protein
MSRDSSNKDLQDLTKEDCKSASPR